MQDGIIKGTGNSRYLKSISNFLTQYPTYQDFVAALVAGTLPIDLNGINETGWDRLGTALNTENLLSNETVEAFGDLMQPTTPENPVPNDALKALAGFVNGNSYFRRTLLNTYTSDGSQGISFSFSGLDPKKQYYFLCEPMSDEGLSSSIGIMNTYSSNGYQYALNHTSGQISKQNNLRISGYSPVRIDFRVSGYTGGRITAILLTYMNTHNSYLNMLSANGTIGDQPLGILFSNSQAIKISLYMEE